MAHWTVEHSVKVLIGVTITAALGGVGYIATMAMKVPNIELTLAKQQQQLVAIRIGIFKLREGKEFDQSDLEKFLSGIQDYGDATSKIVRDITIMNNKPATSTEKTRWLKKFEKNDDIVANVLADLSKYATKNANGRLIASPKVAKWLAKHDKDLNLKFPLNKPKDISTFVWSSIVFGMPIVWGANTDGLSLTYPGGTAFARTKSKVTEEELKTIAKQLNEFHETAMLVN